MANILKLILDTTDGEPFEYRIYNETTKRKYLPCILKVKTRKKVPFSAGPQAHPFASPIQ
uniref:Uncharacterized protein n=1 Tax=Arundo donax TaxID=35708 RepID=A0A0A9CR78_ARUDO